MNTSPFHKGDKVVGYCRYSEGAEQGLKNQSTEEQADAIKRFCEQNELVLTRIFADPFASGRSVAKRDHYLEMLSYLLHKKKPDVQGLIVWDWERYGRNFDQAQLDAARLRMAGYKLFSLQQPIADDGPFAHVLEAMYFASAQNQSDMISADVKRAKQANFTKWKVIPRSNIPDGWIGVPVQMGFLSNGEPRIGYRAEPDPEYIDKIRAAIDARFNGATVKEMRMILGGKFDELPIKTLTLMKKTLLYGSMTYGGTTMEDYCTPIIDKATFDRLQVYNTGQPKRKRSPGAGVYSLNRALLSGLLVCAECGERMHLDRRKAKGKVYETYYCNHYHIGLRRELIEDLIMDEAPKMLTGESWENAVSGFTEAFLQASDKGPDKSTIEREIAKIDRKLDALGDAIANGGGSSETLLRKLTDLEDQKAKLRKSIEGEGQDISSIIQTAEKMRDRILTILNEKTSTTDDCREALASFVDKIIVEKSCRCMVIARIPGISNYSGVAGNLSGKDRRPSQNILYTCKFVLRIPKK